MIFIIVIVLLAAEMYPWPIAFGSFTLLQILVYVTISLYLILIIMVQYDSLKTWVWWIAFIYLVILFFVDFFFISMHEQVKNFWIPFFIFFAIFGITALFVFFTVPQRFC